MIGTTLAHYRVTERIGAGGMGEVYRATDTRLGREVAIKLLPADFASDPERRARFEREARLLAALNHPNIAAIHGFEEVGETRFLALELVEGEDLSARLSRGAIPAEEVLGLAVQIAEALEEAHEKGIVHRDLKPANVKLTPDGRLKVLDFGLAKAWAGDPTARSESSARLSESPTLAQSGTHAGVILGTAAYMSPEQARGKPVDRRADIWAFGVVVFEMLTGEPLFGGETLSDVLAGVLRQEVAWDRLPRDTPKHLEHLLRRCLNRDPRRRLRDIGEARVLLTAEQGTGEGPPPAGTAGPRRWLVPGLAMLAFAAAAFAWLQRPVATAFPRPVRFSFHARSSVPPTLSISHDGRILSFGQSGRGLSGTLWTRRLESLELREIPGTDGVVDSFLSPDGGRVGFVSRTQIGIAEVETGSLQVLSDRASRRGARGGCWLDARTLLLGLDGAIHRWSIEDGSRQLLVAPREGEVAWSGWPAPLPDGRRFLFTSLVREGAEDVLVVQVASVEAPADARVVAKRAMTGVWSAGHLVYAVDGGSVYAQPVGDTLEPAGERILLGQSVEHDARFGWAAVAASFDGVVALRTSTESRREFVWLDRTGRRLGKASEPGPWRNFDVSANGSQIAATARGQSANSLWLIEPERGVTTRLSREEDGSISDPTWSPDGERLAFRAGDRLVLRSPRGGETAVLAETRAYPDSWSRDGVWLSFGRQGLGTFEAFALRVDDPEAEPVPISAGVKNADESRFSPNGRWVAYHAIVDEREEVFVVPFPPTGETWQVSSAGGVQPRWNPDGDELFYLDLEGNLMRVAVPGSDPRGAKAAESLFGTDLVVSNAHDQYAVASGDRFLFLLPIEGSEGLAPIEVVIGWAGP